MFKSLRLRSFTTAQGPKPTNLLVTLGIPSILAAGAIYYYSTKPKPAVAALDPNEWKDFKLQKADGSPKFVIRPYTPIEDPADGFTGYFDLVVKKYPDGKMSGHIHDLKEGDTLSIKGPTLKIKYVPNEVKEIGMVAGGTGITPMLQVIQKIISNPADKTKVSLIFANVTEDDILLKKYLDKVQATNPDKVKIHYVLDKPPAGWQQGSGFVNEEMLKKYLPPAGSNNKVFVCGPPPMMNHISGPKNKDYTQGEVGGLLKKLGYTETEVFKF